MTFLEAIGAGLGIACVVLTARQNIWCWPIGLLMVSVYAYIFWSAKLYSDAGLQAVYVVMQVYAWIHWARGGERESKLAVTLLSARARGVWLLLCIGAGAAWGHFMATRTDAASPYADAFIVVMSLTAQWLLGRKKLESWLIWIVVDVLAVWVYTSKALYITAGLYGVFLVLAVLGLMAWRRSMSGASGAMGAGVPREGSLSASSSLHTEGTSS